MNQSKQQQNLLHSTQSGFTIIESLLAIIIVTLLMTAVAPVIALSVATRVQAKRVELATAAAKSYIDGVRSGSITPPPIENSKSFDFSKAPAPSAGSLICQNNRDYCKTPKKDLYCIDGDDVTNNPSLKGCSNKSSKDLVIQAIPFNPNATSPTDTKKGYQLGIRVYRADAFTTGRTLLPGTLQSGQKGKDKVASSFTGGTGLRRDQPPLVKMKTEIVTDGDQGTKFLDVCQRVYKTKFQGAKDDDAIGACS
jgi:prepilin-type N-terminal cleavage/methylation domain-containing protein